MLSDMSNVRIGISENIVMPPLFTIKTMATSSLTQAKKAFTPPFFLKFKKTVA